LSIEAENAQAAQTTKAGKGAGQRKYRKGGEEGGLNGKNREMREKGPQKKAPH